MLQLARLSGAANIIAIEPIKEKREQALKLGADIALDPKADNITDALKKQGLEQVDVVIECVGRPETIEQAIALAGKYSTVMMFGLTKLDVSSMIYKTEPLEELPSILADGKRRGAGKYIITM